jgi:hypothetical protein
MRGPAEGGVVLICCVEVLSRSYVSLLAVVVTSHFLKVELVLPLLAVAGCRCVQGS